MSKELDAIRMIHEREGITIRIARECFVKSFTLNLNPTSCARICFDAAEAFVAEAERRKEFSEPT